MKCTSTNGVRLNVKPKHWWNLNHIIWMLDHLEICSGQDWYMSNREVFTYGTIERL